VGRRVAPLVLAGTLLLALTLPAGSSAVYPDPNPWFTKKFLNIAHQGGEEEAPSETLFALKTAMRDRGADMLEIDVNLTIDGHLVVTHDDTVNRTTESTQARTDTPSSMVRELTLSQVQALDAGYSFESDGTYSDNEPGATYPYRGIRTGAVPPPAGYTANDFRIPTLREVLDTFPTTPINIEIKLEKHQNSGPPSSGCQPGGSTPPMGYCDDAAQSMDVAAALAAVLDEPQYAARSNDFIVVSFSDDLVAHFRSLDDAPALVPLAPGLNDTATYVLSNGMVNPDPDVAAFQIPPEQVLSDLPGFTKPLADADGYAIHVWPNTASGDTEAEYQRFLDLGVQGYMASKPLRLHNFLCANEVPRPDGSDRCPPPAKKKAKKKCKKLRGKMKRQKRGLGRASTEAKRADIQENIADTERRLSKLNC
jgi:glycerophosphoryl diester phosphodiesterase